MRDDLELERRLCVSTGSGQSSIVIGTKYLEEIVLVLGDPLHGR